MTNQTLISAATFLISSALFAAEPVKPAAKAVPAKPDPVPPLQELAGPAFVHAGPMVGHVSADTASLWVKASSRVEKLGFRLSLREDLAEARTVEGGSLTAETAFCRSVTVDGLQPATRYYYAPVLDGVVAVPRPYPSFVTAPAPGAPARHRIALASCVGRRGYLAAASWGEMAARGNLDLLLMLGDNHYGDTTDPVKLRDHYFEHRSVGGFRDLIGSVPTYAIWDDHDYGPNNSDGTAKGKEDSLRIFREWWANASYGEPENPGVYGRFSRGDVDFFLLDVRYHRTPNKAEEDGKKTMLGARQLAWLKESLSASKAKFKIVASGSEFQTLTQPDCWSSFARERQEIFDHITNNKIEGVVLVSGDRHFTAGYHVQGKWVEFTSGPIGSGNATLKENPERFTGADEEKLWVVLELDTTATPPAFAYEIWQAGGGLLERRALSWDQLNGRARIEPSPTPLGAKRMEAKPAAKEAKADAKK